MEEPVGNRASSRDPMVRADSFSHGPRPSDPSDPRVLVDCQGHQATNLAMLGSLCDESRDRD
eukprot:3538198-Heterocapsa_arctica.AAC.1